MIHFAELLALAELFFFLFCLAWVLDQEPLGDR